MQLNTTLSPISREERNKINENWQRIIAECSRLQRQINILAGGQEVDELLERINTAVQNAEITTAEMQELIAEVDIKLSEIQTAIINANNATDDANALNMALTALKSELEKLKSNLTQSESVRQSNEETRIANENARESAENTRETNEQDRIDAENIRQSNESSRENNESTRQSNETSRQTAETNRETAFNNKINEVDTAISNANTTTTNLQTLIDDTISVGNFDLTAFYKKNNNVLDNGSTWVALQDTQNNPLPILPDTENAWWRLVARKGVDGTGSVSSVNNVSPDIDGNVPLSPNDIGAIASTEKGVANGVATLNADGKVVDADGNLVEGKVTSVNTKIGDVVLTAGDVDAYTKTETDTAISNQISLLSDELTPVPPVQSTLVRGEQTLTTEHDSTARVTAFEGDTIVNLVPLFDSGLFAADNGYTINSPTKMTLNAIAAQYYLKQVTISVKQNTNYYVSCKHNGNIGIYNADGSTPIVYYTESQGFGFNSGNNSQIRLYFRNKNNTIGTFTFEEPMLNEGTEQKPFVANVQGITNPTIDNPTTGDSLTLLGTFHKGDVVSEDKGQYSKQGTKKETILDDKLTYSVTNYTGFKRILVQGLPKALLNSQGNDYQVDSKLVKYNGLLIPISSGISPPPSADVHKLTNGATDGNLYFTVSNADIGIGDNYTPTADELKAFILGYVMYDGTKGASAVPGVDLWNGTTSNTYKYWAYRGDSGAWVSVGTTLPTTQAPINSKWKPYKLLYDLASPVKEPVRAINDILKLAKGDNALQASEGRIVRERVTPSSLNTTNIYINDIGQSYSQLLNFKTSKILAIYKNGEIDNTWTISNTGAYGNERAYKPFADFDQTAAYTIDYEPLYPFEVTAPTNPITIEYQSNLASVVGQNVEDIVELKEDVAVIERDMVRKGEGVEWLTPVLLNGVTGDVKISKDSNNIVEIIAQLTLPGALSTSTTLFFVPKEFRPTRDNGGLYFSGIEYTVNTDAKPILLIVNTGDGSVQPGFATTKSRLNIAFRYRAGQ